MKQREEEYITESLLLRFFSGETSEEETKEIIKWIQSSDDNYKEAKDIYSIYSACKLEQAKSKIDINAAFNQIEGKIQKKRISLRTQSVIQLLQKIAVIIVLPLSIFTGYLLMNKNTPINTHYIEITSKKGMVSKTVLPDSTVVWLNSGSTLKYPSAFTSSERNVELEGEAYFDVQKNEDQPFYINKGQNLSVHVLGTSFNIEAYADDDIITTTLVEGKVKVSYRDTDGTSKESHLSPSQKLVYNINNKDAVTEDVSVAQYIAWKDGEIIFEDTGLKNVLRLLSKHFNVDFKVKNEQLYTNAFTGKFEGERLDEILTLIKMSSNINYRYIQKDSFNEKRIVEIY